MKNSSLLRPALAATFALSLLLAPSGARANETDVAVARDSMTRGKTAFEKGDYATARAEFLAAYGVLSRQPPVPLNVLLNLGSASYKLGKSAEAAGFYRQYLAHPAVTEREKGGMKSWFDKSRGKVAEVTIEAAPGATITDIYAGESAEIGRAPLPASVYLEPGEHVLFARWDGHEEQRKVVAVAGGIERVALGAQASAPPPVEPAKAVSPPKEKRDTPPSPARWIVGAAGWGVGAVLLGGGIGFGAAASSKRSTIDELRAEGASCNRSDRCTELLQAQSAVNTDRVVSTVGIIAGSAVLVGTTLAVIFWPKNTGPVSTARVRVQPSISLGHVGIQGEF